MFTSLLPALVCDMNNFSITLIAATDFFISPYYSILPPSFIHSLDGDIAAWCVLSFKHFLYVEAVHVFFEYKNRLSTEAHNGTRAFILRWKFIVLILNLIISSCLNSDW